MDSKVNEWQALSQLLLSIIYNLLFILHLKNMWKLKRKVLVLAGKTGNVFPVTERIELHLITVLVTCSCDKLEGLQIQRFFLCCMWTIFIVK